MQNKKQKFLKNLPFRIFNFGVLLVALNITLAVALPLVVSAQTQPGVSSAEDTRCKALQSQFSLPLNGSTSNVISSSGAPFYCTASQVLLVAFNYLTAISGTVAILFLIVGAFWFLTSSGSEEQAEKGRKTMVNAILGLVVVIMAVAIVRIVSATLGGK